MSSLIKLETKVVRELALSTIRWGRKARVVEARRIIQHRVDASKERRLFGLLSPKPLTFKEAKALERKDTWSSLSWVRHSYGRTMEVAVMALAMTSAPGRDSESDWIYLSGSDYWHLR